MSGHRIDAQLELARNYVTDCFRTESPPRVSGLASLTKESREELTRRFRKAHGYSPSWFLKQQQFEFAKILLLFTDWSVARIAYRAAFGTRKTLQRVFVRRLGMTPHEFRRTSRADRPQKMSQSVPPGEDAGRLELRFSIKRSSSSGIENETGPVVQNRSSDQQAPDWGSFVVQKSRSSGDPNRG